MRRPGHWQLRSTLGVFTGALVLSASGIAVTATAAQASTGPVSATPVSGTPQLAPTGSTEQITQLVQCGGTMYAVGSFTSISQGGTTYTRNNAFSFSATSPYAVTSWNPNVNGRVNTIAFSGSNCSQAYLGGKFTSVDGTSVQNLAEVSTSTGAVNQAFGHNANGQVNTMLVTGSHVLTGGFFTSINGTARNYYSSLNVVTGRDDGYLWLGLGGNYQYSGVVPNSTNIASQQLSHAGRRLLVEGDFTSAGGRPHQQIFMLYLGSPRATVTGWNPTVFNTHCVTKHPFYVKAAAWSPTDNTVYTATTGDHTYLWNGTFPQTTPCDTVAAFPATQESVIREWTNYAGCDSLFSVAADTSTVYAGGHERWANNASGCNNAGPGAISAPGMGGFSPTSGALTFNPTRARGLGADDMMLTTAGLWIASDNLGGANTCGGVSGHAGICFLPYS
ncbi:MAG TPA: hypothetical protein VGL63_09635 [Streptosporangiaceae bacterium]|jgi:hypothetical protein